MAKVKPWEGLRPVIIRIATRRCVRCKGEILKGQRCLAYFVGKKQHRICPLCVLNDGSLADIL